MKKFKAFIVDDHRLFRKGLKFLLENMGNVDVCCEAENGVECIEQLNSCNPDIIFMDIQMPEKNGIETAKEVLEMHPSCKIIALSMHSDEEYYSKLIEIGVKGFIQKNADTNELQKAIKIVLEGGSYFSNDILQNVILNLKKQNKIQETQTKIKQNITERESEILKYLCKGLSNSEIAEKLFVSQRTVDNHRANLLAKFESKNSIQLVIFALKNNIINFEDI
jgi:DNA-binding NarL/FixJ family response regulator